MGTVIGDDADAAADFHTFFEQHYAELARLAHLLTGEADAADDLAADALVAMWRHWDRVRAAEHPVAYARGVVANLARSRIRSAVRERRRIALFWSHPQDQDRTDGPDVPAVLDVREALQRLPFRKRACVVLRHAFDLSERDTAAVLGISVGTVKSQTSRGVAELERLLAPKAGPVQGAVQSTVPDAVQSTVPDAVQSTVPAAVQDRAAAPAGTAPVPAAPRAARMMGAAGPAARPRTGRGV
ncbi:RNA polymerase sigma-70 factor, sigma-E family [Actinacidiphila alni]|uniref:RNA polymerase sigma-70 factor, sigma-E family n=1 Tax=Actinacidiphila alni TaxID=380248 RepID=A0A1I2GI45_9ACTN|nr:RNA polymerase sigma-70 factor, sigma-E family [Actinacidiphila alni]